MRLSLLILCILNTWLGLEIVQADTGTFQPVQRSTTSFPIRDTSYMGPFRNSLEEKVQMLMKQRRKSGTSEAISAENKSNNLKRIVPRNIIPSFSAKLEVDAEHASTAASVVPTFEEENSNVVSENFNELFLDLNHMNVKPKQKLNQALLKNSESIKPLNAKKSQTLTNELGNSFLNFTTALRVKQKIICHFEPNTNI